STAPMSFMALLRIPRCALAKTLRPSPPPRDYGSPRPARSIASCVQIAAATADQTDGRANHAPFRRHVPRSDGHALDRRGHVVFGSIEPRCERRAQGAILGACRLRRRSGWLVVIVADSSMGELPVAAMPAAGCLSGPALNRRCGESPFVAFMAAR